MDGLNVLDSDLRRSATVDWNPSASCCRTAKSALLSPTLKSCDLMAWSCCSSPSSVSHLPVIHAASVTNGRAVAMLSPAVAMRLFTVLIKAS